MDDTPTRDAGWRTLFWVLLGVLLAVRLVYLAVVPLELAPDEAYYWDWSRQLDYGYYSKPPLIAWIIASATAVLGSAEVAIRLPAVLLGTGLLIPVFYLGRSLGGAAVGFWAAVLAAATPAQVAMSLLMTIDAPMLFCWILALWSFWELARRAHQGQPFAGWWVLAVLAVGVGLLAKQTMLGFFALAGLFLLATPEYRRGLLSGWFWSWALTGLLFLVPVVVWNARHGWITVQHTSEHFGTKSLDLGQRLVIFAESLGGQAGVLSPVTWAMVIAALVVATLGFRHLSPAGRFLYCFSGPPLAAVFALCLVQRVQPNWPAPFYIAGLLLATMWLVRPAALWRPTAQPTASRITGWWFVPACARPRCLAASVATGLSCAVVVMAAPWLLPALGWQGSAVDPLARLSGWKTLAQQADEVRGRWADGDRLVVVAATSRPAVSALAYYLSDQPRVYRWNPATIDSQHEIWGGPREVAGRSLLVIVQDGGPVPEPLARVARQTEAAGEIEAGLGSDRSRRYSVWRLDDVSGWPDERLTAQPTGRPRG